jgi:hypothetical protein
LENPPGANAQQQQVIQAAREKGRRGDIEIGARPVHELMAANLNDLPQEPAAVVEERRLADVIANFMGADIIIQIQRRPGWKESINCAREKMACRDERRHF